MSCAQRCRPPSSSTLLQTMKTSRASATVASGEEPLDDRLGGGAGVILTEAFDEAPPPVRVVAASPVQIPERGEQPGLVADHRARHVLGEVEVRSALPADVVLGVGRIEDH